MQSYLWFIVLRSLKLIFVMMNLSLIYLIPCYNLPHVPRLISVQ